MNSIHSHWRTALKRSFGGLTLAVSLIFGPGAQPDDLAGLNPLLVYDFDLGPVPGSNVDYVESLGFDGIVTRLSRTSDVAKLTAYANYVTLTKKLDLYAYVNYDFNNADSPQVWLDALPILADMDAPLWVFVKNAPSMADVDDLLLRMARASAIVGVPMVLYPHWGTDIENADDAAARIAQVGHPNLSLSLHTCHEIRSGNQFALGSVVAAHGANTSIVTIAGADNNAYAGPPLPTPQPWDDAIQPLDRSRFNLAPFLEALQRSGYDGPIVIHTYGLAADIGHLQRSVDAYGKLQKSL